MTAPTMPAQPAEDTTLGPLPWRRTGGVIWRQHRFALVTVATLLGALAVYLWIVGSSLHNAYAAAVACHPAGLPACQAAVNNFNGLDNFLSNGVILQVLPAAIGAFAGAPLTWARSRSPAGRWPPSRSVPWPACSSAGQLDPPGKPAPSTPAAQVRRRRPAAFSPATFALSAGLSGRASRRCRPAAKAANG